MHVSLTLNSRLRTLSMEQRTQVSVKCPVCQWRNLVEMEVDDSILNSPLRLEIQKQLEMWLASRCPDHLGPILQMSKN